MMKMKWSFVPVTLCPWASQGVSLDWKKYLTDLVDDMPTAYRKTSLNAGSQNKRRVFYNRSTALSEYQPYTSYTS